MNTRRSNAGRTIILPVVLSIVIVAGFYFLNTYIREHKQAPSDYRAASFLISGKPVTLVGGMGSVGTQPAQVRFFGNEAKGDLDHDGILDMAYLVTEDLGGGVTRFFAVGALQDAAGHYRGTQAVMIGDNVAPQTTEIRADGILIVNYGVRTGAVTMGKSLYLKLDPVTMQFGELVQNFEGESA